MPNRSMLRNGLLYPSFIVRRFISSFMFYPFNLPSPLGLTIYYGLMCVVSTCFQRFFGFFSFAPWLRCLQLCNAAKEKSGCYTALFSAEKEPPISTDTKEKQPNQIRKENYECKSGYFSAFSLRLSSLAVAIIHPSNRFATTNPKKFEKVFVCLLFCIL